MGFASAWLREKAIYPGFISEAPGPRTGIIVVIPSYNEPGITSVLDSLAICIPPVCETEVLVVVNAPADAPEIHRENNRLTLLNIESWKERHTDCFFRLHSFTAWPVLPGWGVGLARKTGMDEALRRFDQIDFPAGVILNLDADCTVDPGYLVAVEKELLNKKDRSGCSIYFEHPVSGEEFPWSLYQGIIQYELHLRYYLQAVASTGFPYVFHTVGSAFAVKAVTYMKSGGMNRRQAGEDFYFIEKVVPGGGWFTLNSTTVYPSPRTSCRVPFGTGATMEKLSKANGDQLQTYDPAAFNDLRILFTQADIALKCEISDLPTIYSSLPAGVKAFISQSEWVGKMSEIRNNTSGLKSFRKRFFAWFNMFKMMKYLNYAHLEFYARKPVTDAAVELLNHTGHRPVLKDPLELLLFYRNLEKSS